MGWINWFEFAPAGDTFLCKVHEDKTTKQTESGLFISAQDSVVEDRPSAGIVVAIGPDAPYKIGDELFWTKTSGYDMEMIRKEQETDKFLLLHPDAILGKREKDTRA